MESRKGVKEISGKKLYDLVTRCLGPRDPKYLHYLSQHFPQRLACGMGRQAPQSPTSTIHLYPL